MDWFSLLKLFAERTSSGRASPANALNRVAQSGARNANLSRSNSYQGSPYPSQQVTPRIKQENIPTSWTPNQERNVYGQTYNLRESTTKRQLNYADSPYGSDNSAFSAYPDPSRTQGMDDQYDNSGYNSASHSNSIVKQQDDSDDDLPVTEDAEWDPRRNNAKLKGVIWPGMDIFDSATPEMRRRRNQKKSQMVIEQLETNSCNVENLESVWHANGDLKKSKEINGMPSSSSPVISSPHPALPIRNSGLTMSDFHRQPFDDTPASARNVSGSSYRSGSSGKTKRNFEAYHDGDGDTSHASFDQPMHIAYLTRGMSEYHDTDDVDARPARRRMRDDGYLDNRPYENMSSLQSKQRNAVVHGKHTKNQNKNKSLPHTNILKQAAEKMLPPNYTHGQGNYRRQPRNDAPAQRNHESLDTSHHGGARSNSQGDVLRGVGSQFMGPYGSPGIFGNGVGSVAYRSHSGGQARRSIGSINIEDLVNNYPSAQQMFLPNGAYPAITNQSFNFGPPSNSSYEVPIPHGYDMSNILNLATHTQSGTNSAWHFEENLNVHNSAQPHQHVQNSEEGTASDVPASDGEHASSQVDSASKSKPSDNQVEYAGKSATIPSTPSAAVEDDGRTITASSPSA